ncbi:MAG: GDP-fucose synthetase [Pelagibacteraceae bacterium TMED65]|nr:MAG: GDP-fucose synthetase [Pelagibacteraceae bacterium TMED65]
MIKKILFTGGSGMVGKNFLENSKVKKFKVLAPSSKNLDLRNFKNLKKYIKKNKPDLIIHSAAKVGGIQANLNFPLPFLLENLEIGKNVILAAYEANVKKLINIASSCMYPKNFNKPLKEENILDGKLEESNEGYALAKILSTRLCQYINNQNSKFRYKTLIPCNMYGKYDKFDPEHSHLIPAIIHKLHIAKQRKAKFVEVWGNGLARREFMFAEDFAEILFKSIIDFNTLPEIMNVGPGYDYTVKQYYVKISKIVGYDGKFIFNKKKPTGVRKKLISNLKLKNWGWNNFASLSKGILKTYAYYNDGRNK